MSFFHAALWAELLKARRSKVPWLTAAGFSLAPLMGGLFMIILKDPERARSMGLITAKAQMVAGVADWPSFLGLLTQATAVGGSLLFSLVTAWVFGREHSDRTAKELLALPTPRGTIVSSKFVLISVWVTGLTVLIYLIGLVVGAAIGMPGGSAELIAACAVQLLVTAALTLALMTPVALLASSGEGYLLPMGWAILTLFLAQLMAATGWGPLFPWSVPALHGGLAGPEAAQLDPISYLLVALTSAAGLGATFLWWRNADQTR